MQGVKDDDDKVDEDNIDGVWWAPNKVCENSLPQFFVSQVHFSRDIIGERCLKKGRI